MEKNIIFEVAADLESLTLAVNIKKICTDATILSKLINPQPMEITAELLTIIREVQIYEGVAYFSSVIENYRLPQPSQGDIKERFEVLFLNILENDYCVAQLFNFIFSATRNIAAEIHQCSRGNRDILEKLYINMSNHYDKAQSEQWIIKNYSRTKNQTSSSIFKLISNDLQGSQIKGIQVLISKATLEIDNIKVQQKILQSSMDKQLSQLKKYQEELLALQMNSREIIISEHAILRYLERVYKLDVRKLYKEIVTPKVQEQIRTFGNGTYSVEAFSIRVVDNVVVTVLAADA
jgi:hypothetical protein